MKIIVSEFIDKFRAKVGDSSSSIPENFLIQALNESIRKLVTTPKLDRAFSKHYRVNLKAKDGCKWELAEDFRRISNIPMLNFYSTSAGGDPCPLTVCPLETVEFYNKNGLVDMKQAGTPCEYTIEQEDDHTYLVLDRPSDVPLIIDYIVYGYPKTIEGTMTVDPQTGQSVPTTVELSAVIENLILECMAEAMYTEAEDKAFAGATLDILSNKLTPEALQQLYRTLDIMPAAILGEA